MDSLQLAPDINASDSDGELKRIMFYVLKAYSSQEFVGVPYLWLFNNMK